MAYAERPTGVPGVVLWRRSVGPETKLVPILPDGCMDLLWDGRRLLVAGPDSTARRVTTGAGTRLVALRFSGGTGPALLGVPANAVRDQSPGLDDVWPSRTARLLTDQVAADPETSLQAWVAARAESSPVDPLGPLLLGLASAGTAVSAMADRLGFSTRQLHRRCLPIFGYGPRRLVRVLRLGRAVDEARTGAPLAQVAAGCGYVDQAHFSREVRDLVGATPTGLLRELSVR